MSEIEPNVGIVGTHVKQSLSPVMHNAAYQEMGVDLRYGIFQVPEMATETRREFFDAFLRMQAENGIVGMSVTMPFKEDIVASMEVRALSESARQIGAANTLSNLVQGNWYADNTDWLGAVLSLEEAGVKLEDKTALVLGAGGTARAVTYGLGVRGARHITVANRTVANALALGEDLQPLFEHTKVDAIALSELQGDKLSDVGKNVAITADVIYNTTSVGQDGQSGESRLPFSFKVLDSFRPDAVVEDAVYMPLETPLVAYAQERGLRVFNGTRMLLHQAVAQVRIFTGEEDVPVEIMDRALRAEISRRQKIR